MIFWKDFILDDELGASLMTDVNEHHTSCRSERLGTSSVMEDARDSKQIQETGQDTRPARMVGYSDLDSNTQTSMDAGPGFQANPKRQRGEA